MTKVKVAIITAAALLLIALIGVLIVYLAPCHCRSCTDPTELSMTPSPALNLTSNLIDIDISPGLDLEPDIKKDNLLQVGAKPDKKKNSSTEDEQEPVTESADVQIEPATESIIEAITEPVRQSDNINEMKLLPGDLIPIQYTIRILPKFFEETITTKGEVNILLQCLNSTDKIVLNTKDINIDKVTVQSDEVTEKMNIVDVHFNEFDEQSTIMLNHELVHGKRYIINIKYDTTASNLGIDKTSFFDPKLQKKRLIMNSAFSFTNTRQIFPSFDEPKYKASFTFIIGHPKVLTCLSNTKINKSEPMEGMSSWEWDHFDQTPQISTLSVGFIFGLFAPFYDQKSIAHQNLPIINGYSRNSTLSNIGFAVEISRKIIRFYEEYYETKFPAPKLDIVAVPEYEQQTKNSWGLIKIGESNVFVNDNSTIQEKKDVALIMAKQIASQWFGGLVTHKSWNEFWLHESITTYLKYLAINNVYPEWRVLDDFVYKDMEHAYENDVLTSSPSFANIIIDRTEEIVDSSLRLKGAFILRMLVNFISEKTFKEGVTGYLNKFSHKNTVQEDFWDQLTERSSETTFPYKIKGNIKRMVDSWTLQAGYPIVAFIRDFDSGLAPIIEKRFLLGDGDNNPKENWWIPLSYRMQYDSDDFHKFVNETTSINGLQRNDNWVVANVKKTAFCLVNYDERSWFNLANGYSNLTTPIKTQIIGDSAKLARAGKLKYDIAVDITSRLISEREYLPWKAASTSLHYLRKSLVNMPVYGDLQIFVALILDDVYVSLVGGELDWSFEKINSPEEHIQNILELACSFRHKHCVKNSVRLFREWMTNANEINLIPNYVRSVVYCTAIKSGGKDEWEFAYNKYQKMTQPGYTPSKEQKWLANALGCASEPWLLTRALSYISMNPGAEKIVKEDSIELFNSVANNILGHRIAVSFIREQWKILLNYYDKTSSIYEMVHGIVGYINTPHDVNELKALVADIKNTTKKESVALNQAVETAENNVFWMKNNYLYVMGIIQYFIDTYVRRE